MRKLNNLLLVAFHFPPYGGGSGVHRASRFTRYLRDHGWQPYVLTANSRAYEKTDHGSAAAIPGSVQVTRAFALDAQRHLSVRGRYLKLSALPDRWANWALAAIPAGLVVLYRRKIDLIMVTFPVATAVFIGLVLHLLTGKPLVVDFRDSMTEKGYPSDPMTRAVCQRIEKAVIKSGSRFIFTTSSARQMYLNRYPQLLPGACVVIPNGYDETDFAGISLSLERRPDWKHRRFRLVHAGLIYPDERDPRAFFRAIQELKAAGMTGDLTIDLRASGSENYYSALLRDLGIEDVVHLLPALPHREALQDTSTADALLLFQAVSCDHQIPAKTYEYLRLQKPIFALTSSSGDTAALLQEVGGSTIADLADQNSIVRTLPGFMTSVRSGAHPLPDLQQVQRYTRENETAELAHHFDALLSSGLIPQPEAFRKL